ncbi:hypothetical protein DJ568_00460 [Mucilaginibacter hurinus]|uniref:Putative auto-transporter adhesin head GIN domain-containing protein n=1 Tax=Mucilaginibacter hurinus TaxID=2201324 RepID=A0A367GSF2_9SPHI|nr:DUF2807 domain-containing protein [Mucilaginibacter hurinus]RCH56367.1 hypothetical protein DJ568_00460 [Mucilaginibacter hurinus]
MKTVIITIATICSLTTATVTESAAKNTTDAAATVLTDVANINKIEVRGNVELYVSGGAEDRVKVYNSYYAESALVQNQEGLLRITSYTDKKLVVWVTAADLRSIKVYDNAVIKSFGELSAISLDVQLNNNASAQLNLAAYNASITVNDNAKADLGGNVNEYELNYGCSTSVNYTNLVAGSSHIVKKGNNEIFTGEELAIL